MTKLTCSIHQPDFNPYLGFFNKFKKCDVFVLYDTAQYTKNGWHNRNQIKTATGPTWLTIPVSIKFGEPVSKAQIADNKLIKRHLGQISQHYRGAKYFDVYYPQLKNIYEEFVPKGNLVQLNIALLEYFFSIIKPEVRVVRTSELNIDSSLRSTEVLVEICKLVEADTYISGPGAHEYLDETLFEKNEIKLVWQDFQHPVYEQHVGEFVPFMSIIDALMNIGEDVQDII